MKQFKILFIKPPDDVRPAAIEVPLGPMYLSAYLKKHLPGEVNLKLIDLRFSKHPQKRLKKSLQDFDPDLVGISLLALNSNFLTQYTGLIKQIVPQTTIVIGGPYVTGNYKKALAANPGVDAAVIGEGEKPFLNLVRATIAQTDLHKIEAVVTSSHSVLTGQGADLEKETGRDYEDDLDKFPFPDYSLLDIKKYWRNHHTMNGVIAEKRHTHIISSRACPYNCIYCHNIFGKKVRWRSPENFVAEIKELYQTYGITEFHIVDDIFNIDKARMRTILNLIINCNFKIKIAFPNGLRGDILEPEDIDLLKRAGTYMITFAVESGSPRVQKLINKKLDIEKVFENITYASRCDLITKGFFMIGFPGETVAEMEQTVGRAINSRLDLAHFFAVAPFPGTELATLAREMYPDLDADTAAYYWQGHPFYQQATGYDLKRFQKRAYLKFYFSLRTIKTFFKIPRKIKRLQRWLVFALEVLFL